MTTKANRGKIYPTSAGYRHVVMLVKISKQIMFGLKYGSKSDGVFMIRNNQNLLDHINDITSLTPFSDDSM